MGRHSETLERIRSISKSLHQISEDLRALPEAAGVDRTGLERVQKTLAHVGERASQPMRVAFIGEQSTGKSSILNDLLGTRLPQGENGIDRFVTEILHPDIAPRWIPKGSAAGLRFADGNQAPLSEEQLTAFFDELQYTNDPSTFDEIEQLVLLHPDRWLRHLVFVNTPGLVSNNPRIQRIVSSTVDRSRLVFWVFDARDVGHAGLERQLDGVLSASSSRIHGVLNKVDEYREGERRRSRIKEAVTEVEQRYGRFLTSVIPYSTRADELSEKEPDLIDFKAQLKMLLDEQSSLVMESMGGHTWAIDELRSTALVLEREVKKAVVECEKLASGNQVRLGTMVTRILEPNLMQSIAEIEAICRRHMERIRDRQEPVVTQVLDDEVRTWNSIWRGIAGFFNEKVSLGARIKKRLEEECRKLEPELTQIMSDMAFEVEQELKALLSRIEADLPRRFKGTRIEHSGDTRFVAPGMTAPPMEFISIPDELLRSLASAMVGIAGKQLGPRLASVAREKILQMAAEKAGEAVARKIGQAAAQGAAETAVRAGTKAAQAGAQQAGGMVLKAIARDLLTYWLLVTIPLDILDLVRAVERSRKEVKKAVPGWMTRQVSIATEDNFQVFKRALALIRDVLEAQWARVLDEQADGRQLLREGLARALRIDSDLQSARRALETHG